MLRLAIVSGLLALVACSEQPAGNSDLAAADNEQVQNRGTDKDQWWDALPRPEWAQYEKVEQSEDWFEVYRIDEDIFAIYEPGQFEEVISFLIIGEGSSSGLEILAHVRVPTVKRCLQL